MVIATVSRALLLCSAALVVVIWQETAARAEDSGWSGHLAAGVAAVPDYEGSGDYQAAPLFAGRVGYDTYYLELQGPELRANVSPFARWEFGPLVGLRGGRDDVENDRVDALREIDDSVEVGGFAQVSAYELLDPTDELSFALEVRTGVGDDGEGTTVSFGPTYSFFPTDRLRLSFGASATFADGDYADTFFGVDNGDSLRSGLSAFDPDGGLKDVGVSLQASYQMSEHWGVMGFAGYKQLVGDAADSPIVDDEGSAGQAMVGLGVLYRF